MFSPEIAAVSSRRSGARGWSDAQILAAIRAWYRLYDEVPCLADWDPHRARITGQEWRIRRYRGGEWPSTRTVFNRFGRMSDAITAAGLAPRRLKSGRTDRDAAQRHAFAVPVEGPEARCRERLARCVRAVAAAEQTSNGQTCAALVALAKEALAWADTLSVIACTEREPPAGASCRAA
ncbi:MAG TPA: hypothetical protein VFB41_10620 [Solirubrobacteraceae bacterium]|nr:hypothetical protein [Solirubrobacteraceae bacterium]